MDAGEARAALRIRGLELRFGTRTFVMGILNVTPDSFSGDGLLRDPARATDLAVGQAVRMVDEGADIIDVGGESTRPGHDPVGEDEEIERVSGVVRAIRTRLPAVPISIDTSKSRVAEAALAGGADIINDVAAVTASAASAG
ncbi:MAG TPA: dihydropteroate synthase, partial [Candidatus Limnocylindrales bacterium]|nr:dihydropteroate synthase [Candidatus Limnocylindrales bacterium]